MARAWLTISAASPSRSSSGSKHTDSTLMPSLATSERARAPSIRPVIPFRRSANIGSASPQAVEVSVQQEDLAGGGPAAGRSGLEPGQEPAGFERGRFRLRPDRL